MLTLDMTIALTTAFIRSCESYLNGKKMVYLRERIRCHIQPGGSCINQQPRYHLYLPHGGKKDVFYTHSDPIETVLPPAARTQQLLVPAQALEWMYKSITFTSLASTTTPYRTRISSEDADLGVRPRMLCLIAIWSMATLLDSTDQARYDEVHHHRGILPLPLMCFTRTDILWLALRTCKTERTYNVSSDSVLRIFRVVLVYSSTPFHTKSIDFSKSVSKSADSHGWLASAAETGIQPTNYKS